ncbi:uncharacterized protein LOC119351976 [Triticum dicoccoides]|uniref:uncharacterized protein LOC119351976 n=1 Tax=Triticum dicoccoides TaxID=85692 RepID=UPI00188E16B0|nr:uncharacterized protein LOC119351976 [Triticum dicoccoides]
MLESRVHDKWEKRFARSPVLPIAEIAAPREGFFRRRASIRPPPPSLPLCGILPRSAVVKSNQDEIGRIHRISRDTQLQLLVRYNHQSRRVPDDQIQDAVDDGGEKWLDEGRMAVCGWAVSTRGAAAMCISSCGGTRRMGWSLLQWRTTKGRGAAPPQWRTMTRRCRRREIPIETCSGGKVRARGDSGSKATAADRYL